jgi:hypothetical protein
MHARGRWWLQFDCNVNYQHGHGSRSRRSCSRRSRDRHIQYVRDLAGDPADLVTSLDCIINMFGFFGFLLLVVYAFFSWALFASQVIPLSNKALKISMLAGPSVFSLGTCAV